MNSRNPKRIRGFALLRQKLHDRRLVLAVYLLLRALVILVMIAQLLNGNYENVYICVLTLVLFVLPSLIQRRLRVELPDALQIVILVFIFAAEILGEIQEYYLLIPFWDTILHTINGFLFAAIGFSVVNILNEDKRVGMRLSPVYMAISAFCFSMTIGVLWEFFEWGMDSVFGLDMQKDTVLHAITSVNLDPGGHNVPHTVSGITEVLAVTGEGTVSLGLGGYLDLGLQDTMTDLLVNLLGAAVFCVLGYWYVRTQGKGRVARHFIPKPLDDDPGQAGDAFV